MRYGWTLDRPRPVYVDTPEKKRKLKEKISHCDLLAIDTETTGLDIAKDIVVFWSLSTGDDRYFLLFEDLEDFKDILADPAYTWIGSQIKYDANILANSGYNLAGDLFCTLTMDRLVDPSQDHGLKDAYQREFGERMATFGETFYPVDKRGKPKKPSKKTMSEILYEAWGSSPDKVVDYASMDAWSVFRLFKRLKKRLEGTTTWAGHTLWDIFLWYESPFTRVLFEMERRGALLNTEYLENIVPEIEEQVDGLQRQINKIAGEEINMNSSLQLAHFLYEVLGLDVIKTTTRGKASTDKSVLRKFAAEGIEAARIILDHRGLTKLLGTYIKNLLDRVRDGRVHTTFNQHVADTSRLSSSDPNLQNQPRPSRGKSPLEVREMFIAPPGCKLAVSDYDQVEMYLLGHFSGDEGLLRQARMGRDIHTGNVELVWGEPYDDVQAARKKSKEELTERDKHLLDLRQKIKTVGFGLNYGKAARALAEELGFPAKIEERNPDMNRWDVAKEAKLQAQELINTYFHRVPGARDFIRGTYRTVARTKYVESYLGRRRYLRDVMDWEVQQKHLHDVMMDGKDLCWCEECKLSREGDRQSVNTIIQGSAADVIMSAMLRCHNDTDLQSMGVHMILQIHDELVFEVPDEHVDDALPIIQHHMENPGLNLSVPLRAEPNVGRTWLEAK